jgi:hypothetical protein
MTMIDCALVIPGGLHVVLRNAVAVVTKIAENKFRLGAVSSSGGAEPI